MTFIKSTQDLLTEEEINALLENVGDDITAENGLRSYYAEMNEDQLNSWKPINYHFVDNTIKDTEFAKDWMKNHFFNKISTNSMDELMNHLKNCNPDNVRIEIDNITFRFNL